jgi:hypothetical protein
VAEARAHAGGACGGGGGGAADARGGGLTPTVTTVARVEVRVWRGRQ